MAGPPTVPVGLAEIASRLGVKRQTAGQWRARGLLPSPRWVVSGAPAWEWADVAVWAYATGRIRADVLVSWCCECDEGCTIVCRRALEGAS